MQCPCATATNHGQYVHCVADGARDSSLRSVDADAEMRLTCSSAGMLLLILIAALLASPARGDETCMSPYMPKITGQEDYVYVWTLGVEGVGDGSDKLVTVAANPKAPNYGKVVSTVSVGGRHEAHHGDFTDDRRFFWAGGLDDSVLYVFDMAADPAHPKPAWKTQGSVDVVVVGHPPVHASQQLGQVPMWPPFAASQSLLVR